MKTTERPRSEVADGGRGLRPDNLLILERFVLGSSPRWEWDDFLVVSDCDPYLDMIRDRSNRLSKEYPPAAKGHYCSEAGLEVLREIVHDLQRPRLPDSE